jgi:hypothetical protein
VRKIREEHRLAFREWLERYAGGARTGDGYRQLMRRLDHVRTGRKFSRDEMNSRRSDE